MDGHVGGGDLFNEASSLAKNLSPIPHILSSRRLRATYLSIFRLMVLFGISFDAAMNQATAIQHIAAIQIDLDFYTKRNGSIIHAYHKNKGLPVS